MTIKELEAIADSDPDAREILEQRRAKNARQNQLAKERCNARMAEDPAYAAEIKAKRQASSQKHYAKVKEERKALEERAKTDPVAAEELAARRARQTEASKRSYHKKKAQAETDLIIAAEVKESQQKANPQHRRDWYLKSKAAQAGKESTRVSA